MSKNKTKILAIDPGIREVGVALLEGKKLVYHGVMVTGSNQSAEKRLKEAKKIILRLIDDFDPQVLAVEKPSFVNNKTAFRVHILFNQIEKAARKRKLKFMSYAATTVKKYICGDGLASKREVAEVLVAKFPELRVYLTQDRAWKEEFHQNMFDAVATGIISNELI